MRDIEVYGGGYKIASDGSVYNKLGKKMRPQFDGRGRYYQACLCYKGIAKRFLVHRLVAIHYIDNPDSKREVNHKDGNKTNNNVDNLEWVTPSENKIHARDVLGVDYGARAMLGKFGFDHNRSKAIRVIDKKGRERVFGSVSELSRELGCSISLGSNILSKNRPMPYKVIRGRGYGVVVLEYPYTGPVKQYVEVEYHGNT